MTKAQKRKTKMPKESETCQPQRFIDKAKELGLDNEESVDAFERAFGKIARPNKGRGRAGKGEDEPPSRG